MRRNYPLIPILCMLMLTGCASLSDDYSLYQEAPDPFVQEQNNTRLRTIESLIQTGKGNAAKQQADLINPAQLSSPQQAQFNLLYAQILLSFGDAEQAIKRLATTQPEKLSTTNRIKYFQSQAFAYSLTGNLLESAKARIALDTYLVKPNERKNNQGVILENLGLLPASTLVTNQAGLASWIDIAKVLTSRTQNPVNFNSELARWKTANPDHPANIYLATVEKMPDDFGKAPTSIGVLLPESGSYIEAAKAVKAGFMAAHGRNVNKPALHFYDTETGNSAELYQQAINDGAKLVVGPLNKDSIQVLSRTNTLTTPVLALNHVSSINKQNLYQFALSPMDDVAEITKKAALDGHKKAVLVIPENDQSKRIASYFTTNWQMLNGGVIVKKIVYDPKNPEFANIIKKLFNSDSTVTSATPNHNGIDAIFLSAYCKEASIFNSQLHSQRLGDVPVYAMPTVYSGLVDTVNDNALNGITFCDTPWLFTGAYTGELNMMSLSDVWRQFPGTYIRLVAMGIDAYQLASKLYTLNNTPYSGATGNLTLDSGNRIKRNLVCAKFAMGRPELIGFTHSPTEVDYSGANRPVNTPTTP